MDSPVFIVGMPRSGTTLLASILHASDEIAITPETDYFPNHWRNCVRNQCFKTRPRYQEFVTSVLRSREFARFGFPEPVLDDLRAEITSKPPSHRTILERVFSRYADRNAKPRWGEKTPAHALYVPEILDVFPEARIVHIVRDPRDVILSLRKVPWSERGNIIEHIRKWCRCLEVPESSTHSRSAAYHRILYEELLEWPERTVRELSEFVGIQYSPRLLAFHASESVPFDAAAEPWKRRASQPLDPQNLRKWKGNMSRPTVALVEHLARPHLQRLGYPLMTTTSWRVAARAQWLRLWNAILLALDTARRASRYLRRRVGF